MVKPKYEVEKRTQTTLFLVENSVFLSENDQSAHEFQTPNRISPDLNVLFVRHFFPQKRHRQRVEQKRERAHAWVPFPIQIEEPIENRCKKS